MHLTIVFSPPCTASYIQLIMFFIYSAFNRYNLAISTAYGSNLF